MHFLVHYTDKPNSLALRLATRPAHLEYVKNSSCVCFGGPLLAADGETMAGGMLVLETDTIEQARAWVEEDPYVKAGLFESAIVRAWRWSVGNPSLPKA